MRPLLRWLTAWSIAALTGTAGAESLVTHEANPLLAGYGLPSTLPVRTAGPWSTRVDYHWGSAALIQADEDEHLVVDAETRDLELTLTRSMGEHWSFFAQVPYRELTGGTLDGFIDGWHELFGLPEGARPAQPKDRLFIRYRRDGRTGLQVDERTSGLGDVTVGLGRRLWNTSTSAARLWFTVEVPTGDARDLTGNDAWDASLTLAAERTLSSATTLYGQLGATWITASAGLLGEAREFALSGQLGIGWRATGRIELHAQFSGRSGLLEDTGLDFLGDAVALTLGGTYQLDPDWHLQLAVAEDIAVETCADVVLMLGVQYGGSARTLQ